MREIRQSGSEGGGAESNRPSLPLSGEVLDAEANFAGPTADNFDDTPGVPDDGHTDPDRN